MAQRRREERNESGTVRNVGKRGSEQQLR